MKRFPLIQARGENHQSVIAAMCGVVQQTYSHWERGRTTPSVQRMIILEKVLGQPKELLFPDVFNESPNQLHSNGLRG
ncbi:MAG: helix-turn-helix transcriptional regulator [Bacillota bacterium]